MAPKRNCIIPAGHLILGSILLCIGTLNAQPVCETVRDDVDEFTGERKLQLTASSFSNGPAFDWLVHDEKICFRIDWIRSGQHAAVVFEGDSLMLKLDNDSVITLISMETTIGKTFIGENGERSTKGKYCYWVDVDQLALISQFWVQKVRIYFRDGHKEFVASTDPTWQTGLWRTSNCLRQALHLKPMPQILSGFGQTTLDPRP